MTTDEFITIQKYLKSVHKINQKTLAHDYLVRSEQAIIQYKKGQAIPDLVANKMRYTLKQLIAAECQTILTDKINTKFSTIEELTRLLEKLKAL